MSLLAWLRDVTLAILDALDPSTSACGGCQDDDCDDCVTEWGDGRASAE